MDDFTRAPVDVTAEAGVPARKSGLGRVLGLTAGFVLIVAMMVAGTLYWLNARHFESTDDASVDADVTRMAPRVAGQVTRPRFADNLHVAAGQVLLSIDPAGYQAELDEARARVASAEATYSQVRAQVAVEQANVDQTLANVRVAEADLLRARQDYDRFQKINPNAVSRQQIDAATAAFHSAQAKLDASRQTVGGARARVDASRAGVLAAGASVKQAMAAAQAAELRLSYCTMIAPVSGIVTHRTVSVGDYVNPGQALFALVADGRWVSANFKETQLAAMHPGQDVDLAIDAVPSVTFHGKVDSFQAGTGSAFSVLPAENATGNYVKIVQRVPVRIDFDDKRLADHPLMPGMSVTPSVRVR